MKPAPDTVTQIDELPGEEIEFGIGDPRWVMRTQAELYSDITTAIIREYSTNAWDAHIMAGHEDPIEVTLPNMYDNMFIVKDHGVGMNKQIFKNIYTQFGVSDKRTLSNTNGMLGYGSKSGVAYTSTFTVVSVRDGIKTHGVILRKPDWSIVLKVISESATAEPNGTTISIPVHNVDEFNHKAREFYKFWTPGRVLVNSKPLDHHVGEKLSDNLYYSQDHGRSYVVMGNVPYRINNPAALFYNSGLSAMDFVAYIDHINPNGEAPVDFTPSREDLNYTDRTKEVLQQVIDDFETELQARIEADIAGAANHAEAYKVWFDWKAKVGEVASLTYNGDAFERYVPITGWKYYAWRKRYTTVQADKFDNTEMAQSMVVTDYAPMSVSSQAKAHAKHYAEEQGWGEPRWIYYTSQSIDEFESPWTDKTRFVDWATVKAAAPKKTYSGGGNGGYNAGRLKGSWDVYDAKGYRHEEQELTEDDIYWISTQSAKVWSVYNIVNNLPKDALTGRVIEVPANRKAKFLRENPDAVGLVDWAKQFVVKDGPSLLTEAEKQHKDLHWRDEDWVQVLDPARIDDEELSELLTNLKQFNPCEKTEYERNMALGNSLGEAVNRYYSNDSETLMKKYPLATAIGCQRKHLEELYLYMNAKYKQMKENEENE